VENPPSSMPTHASLLYARNAAHLLGLIGRDGAINPDWEDEVLAGCCVLRGGLATDAAVAEAIGVAHVPIELPSTEGEGHP
jgi:H+-translocating NAD(P) transhydrogenase subunit alpha